MTYSTTITSKGTITLPAAIREQLNLRPGLRVEVRLGRDRTVQITAPVDIASLRTKIQSELKGKGVRSLSPAEETGLHVQAALERSGVGYP